MAIVTLSHPGKFNAMSRSMWRQLREVFARVQAGSESRCVLISGQAGHFCAGGDISEYPDFRFDSESLRAFHEDDVWGGLEAMLACDVPIVAAIEGNCMGAGVEIASCCDIRVASRSTKFGAPIARLGFPMAPREAQLVMRVAGEATAREMLLEGAVLDSGEMKARGFLHAVLEDAELAPHASARARRIASLAPEAARMNKQALRVLGANPPGAIERLLPKAYAYAESSEHREGISAFLSKRPPKFF
ncbi:enoyl-CoA hydratase/isomerase family protein [Ottowia thiooxydans]|uniref:enoyl-CoA hydratase/isomerase family protein n=1 Tax=Ottowia thiooxydans TaxID=219182 RepID=UPI00247FE8C7|nr:enoyl-CoA hydratase/isomerase family protein [Ottowia thiooxydans]